MWASGSFQEEQSCVFFVGLPLPFLDANPKLEKEEEEKEGKEEEGVQDLAHLLGYKYDAARGSFPIQVCQASLFTFDQRMFLQYNISINQA